MTSISGYASYDEYGNPETGAVSTGADSYGWLGTKQRADDSTGLTLMGARLYNPTTGRFTSGDPKVGGNANAYNYPNDPINKQDTTGQRARAKSKHISTAVKAGLELGAAATLLGLAAPFLLPVAAGLAVTAGILGVAAGVAGTIVDA